MSSRRPAILLGCIYPPCMGPLRNVAWGLIVVVIDFKINELDLIADPIGWAIALFALLRLRELHPAFGPSVWAAAIGLALSVPAWLAVLDSTVSAALGIAFALAEIAIVFAVCTALMDPGAHEATRGRPAPAMGAGAERGLCAGPAPRRRRAAVHLPHPGRHRHRGGLRLLPGAALPVLSAGAAVSGAGSGAGLTRRSAPGGLVGERRSGLADQAGGSVERGAGTPAAGKLAQGHAAHAEPGDVEERRRPRSGGIRGQGRHQGHPLAGCDERERVLEAEEGVLAFELSPPSSRRTRRMALALCGGGVQAQPGDPEPAQVDDVLGKEGARKERPAPGLVEEGYVGSASRRAVALAGVELDRDARRAHPDRSARMSWSSSASRVSICSPG